MAITIVPTNINSIQRLFSSLQNKKVHRFSIISLSHQIFRHIHGVLIVGKKKLITQFVCTLRDEFFESN
jgi:hypothetical protein